MAGEGSQRKLRGLEALVNPSSIAVVGATSTVGKLGNTILRSLFDFGFKGKLFPVNPGAGSIMGMKCYPDIGSIVRDTGAAPDSVYIAVPPSAAMACIKDAAENGAKSITVLSSGIASLDEGQKTAGSEAIEALGRAGSVLVGPNCLGIHNPESRVTFNSGLSRHSGRVAFISQSGSMMELFLLSMESRGLGTRLAVSTGNELMLTVSDFIEYVGGMSDVAVVAAYVEEIRNPRQFLRACLNIGRDKTIVVYKAGLTRTGRSAAASHTGAIAGSTEAYSSLFKKCNVVFAKTYDELVDAVSLASTSFNASGRKVAVVSAPGGLCVTLSDALDREGFSLPEFGDSLTSVLVSSLPSGMNVRNPLDLTMAATTDLSLYTESGRRIAATGQWDMMIIGAPTSYSSADFVSSVELLRRDVEIPLAVVWTGETAGIRKGIRALWKTGIPAFRSPDAAATALAMVTTHNIRSASMGSVLQPVFSGAGEEIASKRWIGPDEIAILFSSHGLENYDSIVVDDLDAAESAAEGIGYPLVMKLSSADVVHKSEAGGVILNITSRHEVGNAFAKLRSIAQDRLRAGGYSFTLSRQIRGGTELVIGAFRAIHGVVMMFGLGGTLVELTGMKSFSLCPVSREEAREMIVDSGLGKLLQGYRDIAIDADKLCSFMERTSRMLVSEQSVVEMDINPLIANSEGVWPVDVRIAVRD